MFSRIYASVFAAHHLPKQPKRSTQELCDFCAHQAKTSATLEQLKDAIAPAILDKVNRSVSNSKSLESVIDTLYFELCGSHNKTLSEDRKVSLASVLTAISSGQTGGIAGHDSFEKSPTASPRASHYSGSFDAVASRKIDTHAPVQSDYDSDADWLGSDDEGTDFACPELGTLRKPHHPYHK